MAETPRKTTQAKPKGNKKKDEKKVTPKDYLKNLGYAMELINSDPSLQVWIRRVRRYMDKNQGRTPTPYELDELKQGIDWFERFSAVQEEARMQQADPRRRADWQRRLELEGQRIRQMAQAYGAPLSDEDIRTLALEARLEGLSDQEVNDRFGKFIEVTMDTGGELTGAAEDAERNLLQWSRRNGLTLSGSTISKYVRSIVEGRQSFESVQDDLRKTYLAGQYPAWSDRILSGFDPEDISRPYRSRIAEFLEVDEEDIDLNDKLLQRGMQGIGADGKPSVVPLYEFDRMIRNDERWQYTDNARSTYSGMADQLLKMFGFR
jgi:hypothetical protein